MTGAMHCLETPVHKIAGVPFVLATPHHAAAEVVAQINQAVEQALETACGATAAALGTPAATATRSRVCCSQNSANAVMVPSLFSTSV